MYKSIILALVVLLSLNTASIAQTTTPNPDDQITLEANVVQIILNDEHRSGVDWGAIVSDFHTALLKKENDPLWNDKKYKVSFGTISQEDYAVLLDALDMAGEVSQFPQSPVKVTVGTPVTVNFDKQNIHVDVVLSRSKTKELILKVNPHIAVPATELLNGEKIASSVPLESETDVSIDNSMTVVIGGFMKEEQITRMHTFPLLGHIPIVGLVFRSRGKLMQKIETVVFLSVQTNAVEPQSDDENT